MFYSQKFTLCFYTNRSRFWLFQKKLSYKSWCPFTFHLQNKMKNEFWQKLYFFVFINMSWHEVCQFLDQSDPNDGLGTHKREKMLLSDLLLEGSSYLKPWDVTTSENVSSRKSCQEDWCRTRADLEEHCFRIHLVKRVPNACRKRVPEPADTSCS